MPLNQKEVVEINTIISAIGKELKPGLEIGARDRATLAGLLKASKIEKKAKFFKCKREYSEPILTHFVKEKGVAKNKFSSNAQTEIYLI